MRRCLALLLCSCLFALVSACGGISESEYQEAVNERDALRAELAEATKQKELLQESIVEIYKERESLLSQIADLKRNSGEVQTAATGPENQPDRTAARNTSVETTTTASTARSPAPTRSPVAGSREFYIVKPGDTLSKIADETGVAADRIRVWSDLPDGDVIRVGQKLNLVPPAGQDMSGTETASTSPATPPEPQPRVSTPAPEPPAPIQPRDDNTSSGPRPAPMIIRPPGSGDTGGGSQPPVTSPPPASGSSSGGLLYAYVRPGESLQHIAARTGVPAGTLASLNGLRAGEPLTVGQRLRLR